MGKRKAASKESEAHVSPVGKSKPNAHGTSNEKLLKANGNSRPKAKCSTVIISVVLVATLSIFIGLILVELSISNEDLRESLQKYYSSPVERETDEVQDIEKEFKDSVLKEPENSIDSETVKKRKTDKMADNMKLDSEEGSMGAFEEPPVKKSKKEESFAGGKPPKMALKETEANPETKLTEERIIELEEQIVSDGPSRPKEDPKPAGGKERKGESVQKDLLKQHPAVPSSEKRKDDGKSAKKDDSLESGGAKIEPEVSLSDLYIQVESIAEDILQEDPNNEMVKQLAPHLEGVERDLEGGKVSGLRETLLHIKTILFDLKERLAASRKDNTVDSEKSEAIDKKAASGGKKERVRVPVKEVIPDPVYIAPRGDKDKETTKKEEEMRQKEHQAQKQSKDKRPSTEKVLVDEVTPDLKKEKEAEKATKRDIPKQAQKETKTVPPVKVDPEQVTQKENNKEKAPEQVKQKESTEKKTPQMEKASKQVKQKESTEKKTPQMENAPEQVRQKESTEKKVPQMESFPKQVKQKESTKKKMPQMEKAPEQVKQKESTEKKTPQMEKVPEQVKQKESTEKKTPQMEKAPGQIKQKESTDKKTPQTEKAPEQVKQKESTEKKAPQMEKKPEQVKQKESTDKKPLQIEKAPEQVKEKESTDKKPLQTEKAPEQVKEKESTDKKPLQTEKAPEQVKQKESTDKKPLQTEKAPEQVKQKENTEKKALQPERAPEQVKQKENIEKAPHMEKVPEHLKQEENIEKRAPQTVKAPEQVKPKETDKKTTTSQIDKSSESTQQKQEKKVDASDKRSVEGKPPSKPVEKQTAQSKKDAQFEDKLNLAEALVDEKPIEALNIYGALMQERPKSPLVLLGRAKTLDILSEREQSNYRLEQAIYAYKSVVDLADESASLVPKEILKEAGLRCAGRMNFRGMWNKGLQILNRLMVHFPRDLEILNKMGVLFLTMNQQHPAKQIFENILKISPEDGLASVHYGFILKLEGNYTEAIRYLEKGIRSAVKGVYDSRFYYHLGDAYQRLGQKEKAYEVFDEAVEKDLFINRYQRSIYNVKRLKSQPIWTPEETTYEEFFRKLQSHWKEISKEGLNALYLNKKSNPKTGYRAESENLQEKGEWGMFDLFRSGGKVNDNCKITPITCSLIEDFLPAAKCMRGQSKFSVMEPGTHVYPHAGPTNCRLRSHLGLVTPKGAYMRVVNETLEWNEGELFIFDDSFEHEVWHNGDKIRLILIVDVWHPELTKSERESLRSL